MIVLIPHLVIFFLKLNKPIKLLQELLANIPQSSSPEAACRRPPCRRVSVQAAGSSAVVGGAVYSPSQATGTCKLLASCLPTSQDNLATDGAATHGIKWFSSIGQVSAKVSGV